MAVALTSVLLDKLASTHIWHGRNQSSHHDRMAQPLHLTYSSEWIWIQHSYMTWKEPILSPWQNGSALTFDHGRNQSSHNVRMDLSSRLSILGNWTSAFIQRMAFSAYIWSCENKSHSHLRMAQHSYLMSKEPILSPWQNGSALTSDHGRKLILSHVRMAHGLITCLWREPRSREYQASTWSTQNSP